MRFLLTLFVALLTLTPAKAQDELSHSWDKANTAYVNGDYDGAIAIYDSIADKGYRGVKLYYNLANAHFKRGAVGHSILNYNRALQIDPSDADTRYNLKIANSYVKDNIEHVPEFFLTRWLAAWRSSFSSDSWAIISLVMLALTLGSVLVYLLSGSVKLRKVGFYGALIALVFMLFAIVFGFAERRDQLYSNDAVIMSTSVAIKSSPDSASKDLFILHEGTKVRIVSSLGDWHEIVIMDGKKGWVAKVSIEKVIE